MIRTTALRIGLVCVGLGCVAGCAAPGPSPAGYSIRRVERRNPAAVFDLAEAALIELGYRIDQRDRLSGMLSALGPAGRLDRRTGAGGMRLSGLRPRRSAVQVRIEPADETVSVFCKVLVQEQVTEAHRIVARDRAGRDTPGETPINREAATTIRQNTVWRTLRRDKVSERSILSRILDLTGAAQRRP